MRSRWPLLAILCVLASLLAPGIASASTAPGAETRVWAFDLQNQVGVGVERSLTLELRQGCAPTYDEIASDSLLAARGGTTAARQIGRAGEAAVRAAHDIGPSRAITIGGRTRIPDGLTSTTLSEVKNVQSLSYTSQLRDYAAFAQQQGLSFDLYVRQGAQLSGPLQQAISSGAINLRFIP